MKELLQLKKYFAKYKNKIWLGILFIVISNVTGVYIPILIRDSINLLKTDFNKITLLNYALLIVGIALFSGVFRVLIRQTIIVVSREIEFDIRNDFWAHLQSLSVRYYHNNKTGDIMAHATNDINAVRNFVGPAVMYTIDTFTIFVLTIGLMISISPWLTLLSVLPFAVLSVIVYIVGKKIHKAFTAIQEHFSVLTAKAQENLSGIRIIKSYVKEDSEIGLFEKLSREYLYKNLRLSKIQALFYPLMFLVIGTATILIMWVGGIMYINKTMSLGNIIAFIIYLEYLIWPAIAFGWVTNIVQQAAASQKRLNTILSMKPEISDGNSTDYSVTDINSDIEFRNVTFKYREDLDAVLKNINLKIPAGSSLAVIGKTGSGKTTLANLLLRFYDVTDGEILIGGKNIKEIPLSVLRQKIGFVAQETFLFSDTLKNNISYGLLTADDSRINEAVKISQLSKDIESFSDGLETVIGERGITLSGGQKQRTSLARAVIKNPSLLILDDCLSAVDTYTEEEILKNLKQVMKSRTSIIISHRISTVKDADKIIVLENSSVAEEGNHDQLLELNGIYAELYRRQLLEDELEEIG